MWLLRGLSFTCKALQNAQANKTAELSVAFNQSYDGTLKKFHNFMVKGIFAVSTSNRCYRALYKVLLVCLCGGSRLR
jgi:hypothetical protein